MVRRPVRGMGRVLPSEGREGGGEGEAGAFELDGAGRTGAEGAEARPVTSLSSIVQQ